MSIGINRAGRRQVNWREVMFIVVGLAFCLALVMALIVNSLVRLPWYDEICMVDPAYQWVVHGRFASNALNSPQPYAWNYPLYIFFISIVIRIVGMSYIALRVASIAAAIGAYTLTLKWLINRRLIHSYFGAVFFIALCLSSTFMRNMTANIRPEAITSIVLLGVAWIMFLPRNDAFACACGLLLGFSVPLCGIHMIIPVGVTAMLSLVFYWRQISKANILCIFAGLAIGSISLLVFYNMTGSMDSFVYEAQRVMGAETTVARIMRKGSGIILGGKNGFICKFTTHGKLVYLLFFFIYGYRLVRRDIALDERRNWAFAAIVSLAIPIALHVFTNLMPWYEYIYITPMIIIISCYLDDVITRRRMDRAVIWISTTVLLVVSGGGSVRVALSAVNEHKSLKLPATEVFSISKDDVVATPFSAYFLIRPRVGDWFPLFQWDKPTDDMVDQMTAILSPDEQIPSWCGEDFSVTQQDGRWHLYRRKE